MHKNSQYLRISLSCALVCLSLAGCGKTADTGPAPAASGASAPTPAAQGKGTGQPVSVTTSVATKRDLSVVLEAIGTVTPLSSVDVKPQTNSLVKQVHVKEGQFVRAGEILFTLDGRADEANVAKVQAQMAKDQSLLADAQRQLARSRDLLSKGFVSQGAVDSSQAQVDSQLANLGADRAALDAAQLALSYNTVRAVGAGRLGAINVFPGTAVQINQTVLVTITQLDPINISFSLPQRNLEAVLASLKSGGATVSVKLADAKTKLTGQLQFVDSAVDAATGTVKVRARFANQDAKLWPGAFVKVALVSDTLKDAVVIPTTAIIQSARGSIVYIADGGKAVLRPVKVLASEGEDTAVEGVAAGAKVVVEGRQNLRPDSPLVERSPASAAPAKSAASAASAAP